MNIIFRAISSKITESEAAFYKSCILLSKQDDNGSRNLYNSLKSFDKSDIYEQCLEIISSRNTENLEAIEFLFMSLRSRDPNIIRIRKAIIWYLMSFSGINTELTNQEYKFIRLLIYVLFNKPRYYNLNDINSFVKDYKSVVENFIGLDGYKPIKECLIEAGRSNLTELRILQNQRQNDRFENQIEEINNIRNRLMEITE